MTRNNVFVGDRRVLRRYIGDKLIFGDLSDKTGVLSGEEIFTDRADEEATVHVEIDGKSYQEGVPTPDYPIEIHSLNDFDVVSSVGKENLLSNSKFGRYIGGRLENYDDSQYRLIDDVYYIYENIKDSLIGFEIPNPEESVTISGLTSYDKRIVIYYRGYDKNGYSTVPQSNSIISVNNGEFRVVTTLNDTPDTDYYTLGIGVVGVSGNNGWIKPKIEKGSTSTPYSPSPEDITESDNHQLIDKINLLLDEPLRSIGDVKDRLFRDVDGLWKIERNIGEYIFGKELKPDKSVFRDDYAVYYTTSSSIKQEIMVSSHFSTAGSWPNAPMNTIVRDALSMLGFKVPISLFPSAQDFNTWIEQQENKGTPLVAHYRMTTPTIEILPQPLQDKLNNLRTFKDSNYVYTVLLDKSNILSENLKPTLHSTFKSIGWETFRKKVTKEEKHD